MKIPDYDGLDRGMDWVVSRIGLNDNFWTGFWTVNNYDIFVAGRTNGTRRIQHDLHTFSGILA